MVQSKERCHERLARIISLEDISSGSSSTAEAIETVRCAAAALTSLLYNIRDVISPMLYESVFLAAFKDSQVPIMMTQPYQQFHIAYKRCRGKDSPYADTGGRTAVALAVLTCPSKPLSSRVRKSPTRPPLPTDFVSTISPNIISYHQNGIAVPSLPYAVMNGVRHSFIGMS